eukprot:TRINITY_DN7907_c0_g1_i1.p1 TRINITY_DN7907_c0_g1~~TRINITY_DN7907_c0_g1_i1.p1  ORF type:complete len:250 (-),score=28.58 TRINITY_DN7907_c0_g1_i1:432-1181(-)
MASNCTLTSLIPAFDLSDLALQAGLSESELSVVGLFSPTLIWRVINNHMSLPQFLDYSQPIIEHVKTNLASALGCQSAEDAQAWWDDRAREWSKNVIKNMKEATVAAVKEAKEESELVELRASLATITTISIACCLLTVLTLFLVLHLAFSTRKQNVMVAKWRQIQDSTIHGMHQPSQPQLGTNPFEADFVRSWVIDTRKNSEAVDHRPSESGYSDAYRSTRETGFSSYNGKSEPGYCPPHPPPTEFAY